jgi:hypothetical protein
LAQPAIQQAKNTARCVHCLVNEGTTLDHGIPSSWYPDTSVRNLQRVTAPACQPCQERLQRIENEVLVPFAMSLNPKDPRCAGVPDRMLRSLNPSFARDERDVRARSLRRRHVQEATFFPTSRVGEVPGCGPEGRSARALPLEASALQQFGEKLARVAFWADDQSYLDGGLVIDTFPFGKDNEGLAAGVVQNGRHFDVPPGVFVALRRLPVRSIAGLMVTELWGTIRLFTSVLPAEDPAPRCELPLP